MIRKKDEAKLDAWICARKGKPHLIPRHGSPQGQLQPTISRLQRPEYAEEFKPTLLVLALICLKKVSSSTR